jgi:hypothetical protein
MWAIMMVKGWVRNSLRKRVLGMGQPMAHEMTLLIELSMWPWIMLTTKRLSLHRTTGIVTW